MSPGTWLNFEGEIRPYASVRCSRLLFRAFFTLLQLRRTLFWKTISRGARRLPAQRRPVNACSFCSRRIEAAGMPKRRNDIRAPVKRARRISLRKGQSTNTRTVAAIECLAVRALRRAAACRRAFLARRQRRAPSARASRLCLSRQDLVLFSEVELQKTSLHFLHFARKRRGMAARAQGQKPLVLQWRKQKLL